MEVPQALQIFNALLNILVIPALWILMGIRTEIAQLCERMKSFERRLDSTDRDIREAR